VSKLFDTLEQIRKNESPQANGSKKAPVSRTKKKRINTRTISIILIPALLGMGIYFSLPHISGFIQQNLTRVKQQKQLKTSPAETQKATVEPSAPAKSQVAKVPEQIKPANQTLAQKTPAVDAVKPKLSTQTSTAFQQFVFYNNKGTDLIANEQYWEGISYLDKSAKLQPNRVEPLINIGVALAELGLYGPASRYLKKALEVDPNHRKAIENIQLLTEAGLLDMAL
jgi:tetratricopeptide (TPR) repeat protein